MDDRVSFAQEEPQALQSYLNVSVFDWAVVASYVLAFFLPESQQSWASDILGVR